MRSSERSEVPRGLGQKATTSKRSADGYRSTACKFVTVYTGTLLASLRRYISVHCLRICEMPLGKKEGRKGLNENGFISEGKGERVASSGGTFLWTEGKQERDGMLPFSQ